MSPSVTPTAIDLHFDLDPTKKQFHGSAGYNLHLARRTRTIELHAANLRVANARVFVADGTRKARVEANPDSETIKLHFDALLPIGPLRLELAFRGRVRSDLRGLYRSVDAETPWLATQLCPTDARRFFPCFDEPGIKAPYRISVTTQKSLTVLSNSPVESEEAIEGHLKRVQFETTPLLSAYLIAVAVGPFVASPMRTSRATPIRVYALPNREHLVDFALEIAVESLAKLEDWFDMPHPYAKLDLLALPDFAFGAMENAGAVFFRDSVLLLNPEEASFADRKQAAETITHEISHMWFGNLVTMAWWNDLWLNESFATWMAYEILDQTHPDWQIWHDFIHRREEALATDALATSHAIAPKIRTADEAHENFDAITYTKGACVLRMLEGYLGREVLRDGIRRYIRRHRDSVASASDLWAAISEASGQEIAKIVAPWTLRMGYPIVQMRQTEKGEESVVELTQERFLALPARPSRTASLRAKDRPRWDIPWVGRGQHRSGQDPITLRRLLGKKRDRLPLQHGELDWIYGNARETAFLRIDYAETEVDRLMANLDELSALERIGFVGNQWALARAGRLPVSDLLDLISALRDEDSPDVLLATTRVLGGLSQRLVPSRGPAVEDRFRRWVRALFSAQLDRVGLEVGPDDLLSLRLHRAQILRLVGHLGQAEAVRNDCAEKCARHLRSGESLPAELAGEIIRIAAGHGDAQLHRMLCDAARSAGTPQRRRRMIFGLAEFDEPKLVRATLDASLDVSLAPAADRAALLAAVLGRPMTAVAAWQHLERSWKRLETQMPPILLARLAAATADALPVAMGREVRAFFKNRPLAAGQRVLRQIAEEMKIAKRFEDSAGAALEAYLG